MKAFPHALSVVLGAALGAIVLIGAARAADPMDPHGSWLRQQGGVQLSLYDCETGLLCAKVVGAENPTERAGIGTVILRGAKKVAANEWRGTLYSLEDGKSYDGYISLKSQGAELSVKGCAMGFLCGGETWTRLSSPAPAASSNRTAPTASFAATE